MNFAARRRSIAATRASARAGRARARRRAARVDASARSAERSRAPGRRARSARRRPRRRRDDADRQPPRVGARRCSRAFASAPSCCRAPSSCARRTCACASTWPRPALIVADERNRAELEAAGAATSPVAAASPTRRCSPPSRRRAGRARPTTSPCLITFTSGTAGEPKAVVHAQRYLHGQRLQADALARRARAASSSGAPPPAAGRSRRATCSSRRGCRGAAALLHDARFDPARAPRAARRASAWTCCAWRRPSTA